MAREVLDVFEHVEDQQAAEALSEPFVCPEKYLVSAQSDPEGKEAVAVGAAYITDEGRIAYAFALASTSERPYTIASTFIGRYTPLVGAIHARREEINRASPLAAAGQEITARIVIDKTANAKLRTIAAFAILISQESQELIDGLFVAKKPAQELPYEKRDRLLKHMDDPKSPTIGILDAEFRQAGFSSDQIERSNRSILTMQNRDAFGAHVCALHLPSPREARKQMAQDPRVGNYFSLTRKERRKLIKEE